MFDPSTEPPPRSREILLRPLSPSAAFESRSRQDCAPRVLLPAATEAPALVPELHPLVHVVGRFYPSDRSGVFRSPDLSQFPARARPLTRVRASARMTLFAPDGRLPKDKQRIECDCHSPEVKRHSPTDFPLRRQKIGVPTSDNPSELRTAFHGLAPSPSRFTDKPSPTCCGWAFHG